MLMSNLTMTIGEDEVALARHLLRLHIVSWNAYLFHDSSTGMLFLWLHRPWSRVRSGFMIQL